MSTDLETLRCPNKQISCITSGLPYHFVMKLFLSQNNKQKLAKEHFDDILMFHEQKEKSQSSSKFIKKRTYDHKVDRK